MGIIRLLLALTVIHCHAVPFGSPCGSEFGIYTAVNSFFIISGFYMSLIFTEKYAGKQNSYLLFLSNRFLRIYPLYWIILLATIIYNYYLLYTKATGYIATPQNLHQHGFFLYASFATLIRDLTLLVRTDYLNLNGHNQQAFMVPVAWSLVVELIFYILAPLIVKRRSFVLLLLLIVSFGMRYTAIRYDQAHAYMLPQVFFPACLEYFILDIYSYRVYSYLKKYRLPKAYLFVFFLFIVIATLLWDSINLRIEVKEWLYYIPLVFSIPSIFLLFNKNKVDRFIGELSYPVYLLHLLFLQIYHNMFGYKTGVWQQLIVVTLATVAVAVLLVLFVNKPIDNYRQRRLLAKSQKLQVSLAQ